jgi:hypothetical protein
MLKIKKGLANILENNNNEPEEASQLQTPQHIQTPGAPAPGPSGGRLAGGRSDRVGGAFDTGLGQGA